MAGQHAKEPLPMSQNHIIWAWMSYTEGWVLTATNAYSELAPDSNILCDAGIGTAIVWISVPILGFLFLFSSNRIFTYYFIVITIHLSNLPFPLTHWWYNHEVHTQESPDPGDKFFRSRGSLPRPLHTNTNPCENWIPLPLVAPLQTLQTQTYCLVWNPFKKQGLPLTQGYFRLE